MLELAVIFFALAALSSSITVVLPRIVRARLWVGLPAGVVAIALAAAATTVITGDILETEVLAMAAMARTPGSGADRASRGGPRGDVGSVRGRARRPLRSG